jgi:hypothetical protein
VSAAPFVLVSYLRSGTHLLRTALESHPEVACQSELFNSDDRRLPYPLETPTADVLERWAFGRELAPGTRCAGFVLHAYHPHALRAFPGIRPNPLWSDVWPRLAAMPDLRVIHLRRRDLLARHLSHLLARATGFWHAWEAEAAARVSHLHAPPPEQVGRRRDEPPPIEVDPDRLELDFEEVTGWHGAADRLLAGRPTLHVRYEDLCAEFATETARVQRFLGVEPAALRPAVGKLEDRPPERAIANWGELRRRFAGGPWAGLFTERSAGEGD